MFGLGNILYAKGYTDKALRAYEKVTEVKSDFLPALECRALIYEYTLKDTKHSVELANKIIKKDGRNLWGLFILARNKKTPDEKITSLKELINIHPDYVRATNEIGIVYGGAKKEYDEAISWYRRCTEIVPEYASRYNNVGTNFQLKNDLPTAIDWYFKAMERDREYLQPHKNATEVFQILKWSDQQVLETMGKYRGIHAFFFYYNEGKAYASKKDL